jgi:hypothetical protein
MANKADVWFLLLQMQDKIIAMTEAQVILQCIELLQEEDVSHEEKLKQSLYLINLYKHETGNPLIKINELLDTLFEVEKST